MSVTSHEHTVIYSRPWWVLHPMNTLWSVLGHDECYIPWTHCDLFYVIMSVTSHEHTVIYSRPWWVLHPMNTMWSMSWWVNTSCNLFCRDQCYISCDLFTVMVSVTSHEHSDLCHDGCYIPRTHSDLFCHDGCYIPWTHCDLFRHDEWYIANSPASHFRFSWSPWHWN